MDEIYDSRIDQVVQEIRFCPRCGKRLELHPHTGQPSCFVDGDFEITEVQQSVHIEFKMTRW